jgi:glycosyltransferase involved in cell wall biosynthesis
VSTALPQVSGYTIRTKHILNEISKYFHVVCFVKPQKAAKYSKIYMIDNVLYYHYHDMKTYQHFLSTFLVKNNNVKFLWSASDHFNGFLSGQLGDQFKIKSIYELRGLWHYSRKYNELHTEGKYNEKAFLAYDENEKKACAINDIVLCLNQNILHICYAHYGVNKSKLHLLENGIDSVLPRTITNIKKSTFTFGYIGSIVSYEGIENLITQFKKIDTHTHDVELLIVGGGHTIDAVDTISRIKLLITDSQHIKYIGHVPHDMISEYYTRIDCICIPRVDCEVCNIVTPMKIFEALLYSKIVLASSVNPICDIITHKTNGILFDKNNINDIHIQMEHILNNDYDLNTIRSNAYQYSQSCTWENRCANVLKFIKHS